MSLFFTFFHDLAKKQQKNIVPTSQIHWTCDVNRGGTLCVGLPARTNRVGLTVWD